MREIRQSGSEGGAVICRPYPYPKRAPSGWVASYCHALSSIPPHNTMSVNTANAIPAVYRLRACRDRLQPVCSNIPPKERTMDPG